MDRLVVFVTTGLATFGVLTVFSTQANSQINPKWEDLRQDQIYQEASQIVNNKDFLIKVQNHQEHGRGKINLDYYSLKVTKLPDEIKEKSSEALLDWWITNFKKLSDKNYNGLPFLQGNFKWADKNQSNIKGSVAIFKQYPLHVKQSPIKKNYVVASQHKESNQKSYFTFTTVTAEGYVDILGTFVPDYHFVSGNRRFGVKQTEQGWEIYIKGLDRLTAKATILPKINNIDQDIGAFLTEPCNDHGAYCLTEAIWQNFVYEIKEKIESQGGETGSTCLIADRYYYNEENDRIGFENVPKFKPDDC